MKYTTFLILSALTTGLVASLIGWSMATGYLIIPVIAIPLGIIIILGCRQHVDVILTDDRIREIRSLSALRTLEIGIILGLIGSVILSSYVISEPLAPEINGKYMTNENGTRSLQINLYEPGFLQESGHLVRSITIPNIDAMNEFEAMEYSRFRCESYQENEQKGLVGMTLALCVVSLLTIFGLFYLYYRRKY